MVKVLDAFKIHFILKYEVRTPHSSLKEEVKESEWTSALILLLFGLTSHDTTIILHIFSLSVACPSKDRHQLKSIPCVFATVVLSLLVHSNTWLLLQPSWTNYVSQSWFLSSLCRKRNIGNKKFLIVNREYWSSNFWSIQSFEHSIHMH